MKEFVKHHFDSELIETFKRIIPEFEVEGLIFTVAAFIQPKQVITSFTFDAQAISKIIPKQHDIVHCVANLKENKDKFYKLSPKDQNRLILKELTEDFYGFLRDQSLQMKKMKAIEIYRYFYRFSVEKL